MKNRPVVEDPVKSLAFLDDPKRRQLYELVVASDRPMGRDEAAGALGISRELAAFHLDRLVQPGSWRPSTGASAAAPGRVPVVRRSSTDEPIATSPSPSHLATTTLLQTSWQRRSTG